MKILVRSTSYIMPNPELWKKIGFKNIKFSEYGDILSQNKVSQECNVEIINIFLPDIINFYGLENSNPKKESKKINFLYKQLKKKLSIKTNKSFIICFSSYYFTNIINTSKYQAYFELINLKKIYMI